MELWPIKDVQLSSKGFWVGVGVGAELGNICAEEVAYCSVGELVGIGLSDADGVARLPEPVAV